MDGNINLKKNPITYRKQVNFGEAEPRFPSFFSGWDMIELFTKSKSGIVEDTRELINDFGMHHYMRESIGDYSAGMLKKLSIALAFIGNPKVILLDEPFITLDESALHILSLQIHRCAILKKIDFIITSHQTLPYIIPVNHLFLLENYQLHRYAQFDRNW
ncbi:ATP-binding cassette domain-containing protein [Olivibacter sp. CPCC 100613]|uniref:ATP-binding cassette domain-containing protein n=1 Tax=Olivibacter sp. CPCC 100613 TaxID=3079931 RepID=UPI002FF4FBBF